MSDYFPVHAHSQHSLMDGMNKVEEVAQAVADLRQPAWALTDHGFMSGVVQGYKESKKRGLAFFPGEEFYLVQDVNDADTKATRYHIGLMALDFKGYEALTKLSTLSWMEERFYYKPLIDLSDLAFLKEEGYSDHIAVTTGCYSSLLIQNLLKHGEDASKRTMKTLANWFPNTLYVELQDHGIEWESPRWPTDQSILNVIYQQAQELGLPVVFGGDSHYINPDQQSVHDLMKDICYFGADEDVHFNGGPYHLLEDIEVQERLTEDQWRAVNAGHADLLDRNMLTIPPLDNYKFQVPAMFKQPDKVLRVMAEQGMDDKGLTSDEAWERLDFELDVISKMGMANYHLLIKEHVIDWCKQHDIIVNTRGSANGSLVCYVIGITTVDPMKWGTSFERYLSLMRQKPPDIDVDVDFRGRDRVIAHLLAVWPSMVQVGTYQQIGFSKTKPGEVFEAEDDDRKGSVMVQYMAAMRKKNENFDGKVKKEHWEPLEALAKTPVFKAMGKNPSGFILPGDDYPIRKYLPLCRIISSNSTLTQFNKDDVEAMGFLKIDLLGLRALQTLNGTLVDIGHEPNDWDWIPDDDKDAIELIRKGRTAGVFQYEGFTQRKGGMEMKVRSTLDVIFGLALYRPALAKGGQKDLYLANRAAKKTQQSRLHPIFDSVLDVTHGVPLYQEQVMEMLQVIGMQFAEYNELMTAVKASNEYIHAAGLTFARLQPLFYDLCGKVGVDDDAAEEAWDAIIGFKEYGFNRAHSSSYGLMSYRAAFLKAHYPKHFMVNLLSVWSDTADKVREYTTEATRMGYSVVKPDVNHSNNLWKVDEDRPNCLRKGLVAIPGLGYATSAVIVAERDANGPYTSIQDFITRLPARPVSGGGKWAKTGELTGVCKTLFEANAFRSVGNE